MAAVPLTDAEAGDASRFGGKAAALARAVQAGLPVPAGFALDFRALERLDSAADDERAELAARFAELGGPAAVRSSALDEDSAGASFAGQHATFLNVAGTDGMVDALRDVWRSAATSAALAYRRHRGINAPPRMAAVVQRLVPADVAGVLFTCDPVTGAPGRWTVEASWGLGEAVVAGLVTPDHWTITPNGGAIEVRPGHKSTAVLPAPQGGTVRARITDGRVTRPCLDAVALARVAHLGAACEELFGAGQDVEFAFAAGALYLLQSRPVTTRRTPAGRQGYD
jgi:pyruvate,water dikinase